VIITDNLSSHDSKSHLGLAGRPSPHPARLHPQRRLLAEPARALVADLLAPGAGRYDFADPDEIAHATRVATAQLNARARPWIWGRPQPKHRSYRRRFIYTL
jgi:tRNA G46 methylase TrmB